MKFCTILVKYSFWIIIVIFNTTFKNSFDKYTHINDLHEALMLNETF